jgi:hypothetical protein
MDEIFLTYELIEGAGELAYHLYSNWESGIAPNKLKDKVRNSDRLARVAVVGLGGAGKTTLIKTLTGCDKIDPRIPTRGGICPVIVGREDKAGSWWPFGRSTRTCFVYCDGEGQKPQEFLTSILVADESDILYKGCFDVLIFVLDVKPPLDMHRDEEIIESVDWKRLEKHVQEWSDVALSFLFSAMSQRLKLCVVFVNKCNLVKELFGPERERLKREIKDVLSPFIQRLQPRMKGVLLMDILGSARDCEDAAKVRRLIEEKAFSGAPS